ncbi:hypothetical protein L798_09665 [Zootermopsis nevadensis]|uniref:Uncharacterized protein n=1 Tax=Zootermopsis nevadensis TaxID=136037 RepID=A0A067R2L3_ZOONE|nr:hypothetical protein L798_09665 [Zootermopsis nevadensis]
MKLVCVIVHLEQPVQENNLLIISRHGQVTSPAQLPDFPQAATPGQVMEEQEIRFEQPHIGVL